MNAIPARRLQADAARLAEERAENISPAAQRTATAHRGPLVEAAEWRDPDDLDVRARTPRLVAGYRRVDVLHNLHKRRGLVTGAHLLAATKLAEDYEIGLLGARPGSERSPVRVDGAPSGPGHEQLAAATRYREAITSMGGYAQTVVLPVVLENVPLAEVAPRLGMTSGMAHGLLVGALERLVEHYEERGDLGRQSR